VVLEDTCSNCQIGLGISGFGNIISANGGSGVVLDGATNSQVSNNYIGLDAHGNVQGNGGWGVVLKSNATSLQGATGNTIGTKVVNGTVVGAANMISGNGKGGVIISDGATTKNVVAGNFIGTNTLGTSNKDGNGKATGNALDGVVIQNAANANTVGGIAASDRNVISGNLGSGVLITDDGTTKNAVYGDYIGTDVNGTAAIANGKNGVTIQNKASSNGVGTQSNRTNDPRLTLISGNTLAGVAILSGCNNNQVENCYIGTDVSGTKSLGNVLYGIDLEGDTNTIGGLAVGDLNVISGNGTSTWNSNAGFGIYITGTGAKNNVIENDYIGTDKTGNAALTDANGKPVGNYNSGVYVTADGGGNTIGGTNPGTMCVISNNGTAGKGGYGVDLTTATGETVEGNNIGVGLDPTKALPNVAGWLNGDQTKNTVKNNNHQ
jgi:titin